jgi:hypothetical protein
MMKEVTLLKGSWPQWFGNLGMQFVYIRIRYGQCSIGEGRSHPEAMDKAVVVYESDDLMGVTDIGDAVALLHKHGYKVRTIVVPEHVEELSE